MLTHCWPNWTCLHFADAVSMSFFFGRRRRATFAFTRFGTVSLPTDSPIPAFNSFAMAVHVTHDVENARLENLSYRWTCKSPFMPPRASFVENVTRVLECTHPLASHRRACTFSLGYFFMKLPTCVKSNTSCNYVGPREWLVHPLYWIWSRVAVEVQRGVCNCGISHLQPKFSRHSQTFRSTPLCP
jgi:hypothetical protein